MEHRTALGLFLALASQRPVIALHIRSSSTAGTARAVSQLSKTAVAAGTTTDVKLVDVDANLLHPALVNDTDHHLQVRLSLTICVYRCDQNAKRLLAHKVNSGALCVR